VASIMTPPQKNPAAGEPARGSYRATWKGKLAIDVASPPTMLALALGPALACPRAAAGARTGRATPREGSAHPPTRRATPEIDATHANTPITSVNRV
jgi:hypothetical protein